MPRAIPIVTLLLLLTPMMLNADVTETGSTRFVVVRNQGGPVIDGPHQIDATDTMGVFAEVVQSSAWDQTHGGSSESYQDSNIANGLYSVHLEVGTDAAGGTMGTDIAMGYTEAYFEVLFTVTEPTDFNVAGSYNAFGEINGAVSETEVRIDSLGGGSPSQVIAFTNDDCCPSVNVDGTLLPGVYAFIARCLAIVDLSDGNDAFDIDGTLLPGDYELRVRTFALVTRVFEDTPGIASADVQFAMTFDSAPEPMPGDMDCSGDVDFADVAPFVMALLDPDGYDAAFPECDKNLADMNVDALRNGGDVPDFVNAVLAG